MSKRSARPRGYLLPEDAHFTLIRTRDQLRLMAQLIEPRFAAETEEPLELPAEALSWCFARLARDVDGVLNEVSWPGRASTE